MKKPLILLLAVLIASLAGWWAYTQWSHGAAGNAPTGALSDLQERIHDLADDSVAVAHAHPEVLAALGRSGGAMEPKDVLYAEGNDLPADMLEHAREAFPGVAFTWDVPPGTTTGWGAPRKPDDLAYFAFAHMMWLGQQHGQRLPPFPAHSSEVQLLPGGGRDGAYRLEIPDLGSANFVDFTVQVENGRLTEIRVVDLGEL